MTYDDILEAIRDIERRVEDLEDRFGDLDFQVYHGHTQLEDRIANLEHAAVEDVDE